MMDTSRVGYIPDNNNIFYNNSSMLALHDNSSLYKSNHTSEWSPDNTKRWGVLGLLAIIFCSVVGNVLVCLAVCWERRLQNMTNYFLMSLAIADLLVSIIVMPLGMMVELYGE